MQLSHIRNLLAVADAGSIRGAARQLKVSQPSLTRSIRQLESELQTRLFERTSRGVAPTAAGRTFVARSRMIQNELRRAREELAEVAGAQAGSVAFGVSPQAAIHVLPPALARFRRGNPQARVRIVDGLSHLLLPQLLDGSLDFIVGGRPPGALHAKVKALPLFANQLAVCARKGHPRRNARSLRELADAQWIVYTPTGWAGAIVPDIFTRHGLPPPASVVYSDSYLALLAVLARTDMVGALSELLLEQPLAQAYFERFRIKERLPETAPCLLTRADSPLTPTAADMVAAVRVAGRELAFKRR